MHTVFAAVFEMKMLILSYISDNFSPFYIFAFFLRCALLDLIQKSFILPLKYLSLAFREYFLSFFIDLILLFLTYGW